MRAARFRPVAVLALSWLAALSCRAQPRRDARAAGPRIAYEHFVLDNGLRVFLIEDHATPTVTVVTWYRVGSKDEVRGRTGFAHLFEHLMFTGSPHAPDDTFDRLFEEAGGWNNAWTDSDSTVYFEVAPSDFLERALWLEADRLAGLDESIDQQSLDAQRDIVRNERRQSFDNEPYGQAELLIPEALWPENHGYHWSTIGYHEDLVAATLDDVKAFFRKYYVPNNAVLVIAGDIEPRRARALVEKYHGWIPRGPEPERPRYPEPPPIAQEIRLQATDDVQVPRLYVVWRGTPVFAADEAPLDVAAMVLGDGKSSRLYKRLVYDERVAQDVSVMNWAGEIGGVFQIEITAKPGVAPDALLAAVTEEVQRLATEPPTAAELERAKNSREAGFLMGLERVRSRAIRLAMYDVLARDPDYLPRDLDRYRAVDAEAVRRVAAAYLPPHARLVLVIGPEAD